MLSSPSEGRSRIDSFLPVHDFSAVYKMRINAPAAVVYECLLHFNFNEHWVVRSLLSLRTGKRIPLNQDPGDIRQHLQGTGFVLLADVPGEEVVLGVVGRFWRLDGGRCQGLDANGFAEFSTAGYAKAAWNFTLQPESIQSTILSTETRIECLGSAALWRFRAYWTLVGPFSGLIRKIILQQVKAKSELAVSAALQGPADPQPTSRANS